MLRFPNCKINIGLQIICKRADGYHDLQTLFYPVNFLSDALEILESPIDNDRYFFTGLGIDAAVEDNICYKAIQLLRADHDFPSVDLHLHKMVPMGAGLGGGSADAAYTLLMVDELFHLRISMSKMKEYASLLGSDCAFFVNPVPQLGEGRGEVLTPFSLDLSGKFLVIIKPNIHVSTAVAYSKVKPNDQLPPLAQLLSNEIKSWKNCVVNDFEPSVFEEYPEISKIKELLYQRGAIYAQMSGSGAACYGIFEQIPKEIDLPENWSIYEGVL